jgi:hypothetical protein
LPLSLRLKQRNDKGSLSLRAQGVLSRARAVERWRPRLPMRPVARAHRCRRRRERGRAIIAIDSHTPSLDTFPNATTTTTTAKTERLRQAKAEAEKEIAAYRAEREAAYQKRLAEVRTCRSSSADADADADTAPRTLTPLSTPHPNHPNNKTSPRAARPRWRSACAPRPSSR